MNQKVDLPCRIETGDEEAVAALTSPIKSLIVSSRFDEIVEFYKVE